MSQSKGQITAAPLRVEGVSDLDPDGRIPLDKLINGTTVIIPRWPRFPGPQQPGDPVEPYTILYLYWLQNGVETELYQERYTFVDDKPEFEFPLTPAMLKDDGVASIRYELEGYDGNPDLSPPRKLTIDHTIAPTLPAPGFPDVNINGYLTCISKPPVSEKVRVQVNHHPVFRALDVCEVEWQGFASLNGRPPALTPLHVFRKELALADARDGFLMDIPFEPYVRPMFNAHSGVARYTLKRNGVPIAKSGSAVVKIDRIIPGETVPCGGSA
ncbi:hypothetical protein [Pseudomonas sp. MWU318]|uniref:hypothetical protein n=1 Tax=Pseudomonas sp. MWU318 TaxID=2802569 RepID=UPI001928DD44|nr:hypothetical protein [Pseudomonas sp. MWU318]